jgi:ATP-dependent protease ClpP protease subunit
MILIDKFISDTHRSGLYVGLDMNEGIRLDASGAVFYGLIDKIVKTEEIAGQRL